MKIKGLMLVIFLLPAASQSFAVARYVDNTDATVTDNVTGLIWQQSDDNIQRTWQESLDYCNSLTLGGSSNWRLPNIKELHSIVDLNTTDPTIDGSIFTGVASGADKSYYWSSSFYADNPALAWYVTFFIGWDQYTNKDSSFSHYARCVR